MNQGVTLPMTSSQKLIWMGQALAGDAPLYNMAWRFDLHLALDKTAFAQAFAHVCQTHDALRLTFEVDGAETTQTRPDCAPDFPPILDFSNEADPDQAAQDWTATRAQRPIDLAKSNYDTCLIKLSANHWVWFFNQHHIATDAWSGSLIFKAVSAAYQAITAGQTPKLTPAPAFADYASAEHPIETEVADYWRAKMAEALLNATPYGGARDASKPASTRIAIDFGPDRTARLKVLATMDPFRSISPDLSIFALLATAYATFLSRVTNQSKLAIGTPSHNRATPALKETTGLFIEMFPLSFDLGREATFQDLFKATLAETMGFLRNAKPGASNAATASTFNAVLNYIPVNYGTFAGAKTGITWLHPQAHDGHHDQRLHVYDFEGTGTFKVEMDCNAAVFDRVNLDSVASHFLKIVDALLADPAQVIAKLSLVNADSPEAANAIQYGPKVAAQHDTILSAFAANVATSPNTIACKCSDETVTFAQLDTRATAFAGLLVEKGVTQGDAVLIHATRSINLIAAMLGTLKAGGFFVPVPSETPSERLQTITRLANPKIVLTDTDLTEVPVESPSLPPIKPDQTAYAIFTSGSTGEPKGVEVDHQNLAEYIRWAGASFGASGPKTYPLYSSIGFDLTITSIFTPLATGGRIVIYPDAKTSSDLSILNVFKDDKVDVVKLTPAHLSMLCEQGTRTERIKTLVLGGENLTTELCNRALNTISKNLTIINEYGPTEAVVGCMIHRFDPTTDRGSSVPIGHPADNTTISILDGGLNPVPTGVTGEIYIGGRLAKGYLNRADLTAEKFILHNGETLYRTGDLGRTDRDGTIQYLGRADTQLKIGGVRIEPAEIETAFATLSGVTAALATTYQRKRATPPTQTTSCTKCGISSDFPDTTIGPDGICTICSNFESYKDRAHVYFKTPDDLAQIVSTLPARKTGTYDAIVLLSGGKDSTYALYRFAELTQNILALTLDNGFISEGAKANIRRVTDDLGIDHRFMTTPAMNAIFNESLTKHSNVCQGCFKTIYTLALETARDEGIPAVVTGLSRGQFFETRLTPELFETRTPTSEELDQFVHDARKSYHGMDDAISRNLNITIDETLLSQIEIIDVYRYLDVPVSELYDYLHARGAWTRPDDTGRSTNCLINDVGIYVHKKREGFHNYALPYSWDVRMGHKTRKEAVEELDDEIDTSRVSDILGEIGFDQTLLTDDTQTQLVVYVSGKNLNEADLRREITSKLPPAMVPAHIIVLDALPLTHNGKIDTKALPKPDSHRTTARRPHVAPSGAIEEHLTHIYQDILGIPAVSVVDNFYDMGGDSIAAIQIAILASDQGLPMDPNAVFEHQTIRDLAAILAPVEDAPEEDLFDEPLLDLASDDFAAIARQISGAG